LGGDLAKHVPAVFDAEQPGLRLVDEDRDHDLVVEARPMDDVEMAVGDRSNEPGHKRAAATLPSGFIVGDRTKAPCRRSAVHLRV